MKDIVVAVGFKEFEKDSYIISHSAETGGGEKYLIEETWKRIYSNKGKVFCGFNSNSFDWRWLYLKGLKYCPEMVTVNTPTIDLRIVLGLGKDNERGSLLDYCTFFEIKAKTEGSGVKVKEWFEAGNFKSIHKYLNEDLQATEELAIKALRLK